MPNRKVDMASENPVVSLLSRVPGISNIDDSSDRVNSIVGTVIRCTYQGQRAVAVGANAKVQIGALLDLVDLHLHGEDTVGQTKVTSDEVTLFLVEDRWDTEAEGALRTLAAQLDAKFRVKLRRLSSRAEIMPISAHGLDDIGDHEKYRYTEW